MTALRHIEPEPEEIEIKIPDKLMRVLTTNARHIVLIGGRGSAKSESAARIILAWCQTQAIDILCGREMQNSIDESVHKLLKSLILDTPFGGFEVQTRRLIIY